MFPASPFPRQAAFQGATSFSISEYFQVFTPDFNGHRQTFTADFGLWRQGASANRELLG